MVRGTINIDRDKLRAAIRKLGHEYIFYMLDDAIELLPPARLLEIAEKYIDVRQLQSDSDEATKAGLLADVKVFEKASLAGEYYEAFDVNWKNSMEVSTGTAGWIAQCRRLLDRCVDEAGSWQVGVQWEKVLPPWFEVLSATVAPDEYAQRIVGLLKRHHKEVSDKMFTVACEVATPAQRQMISKVHCEMAKDT